MIKQITVRYKEDDKPKIYHGNWEMIDSPEGIMFKDTPLTDDEELDLLLSIESKDELREKIKELLDKHPEHAKKDEEDEQGEMFPEEDIFSPGSEREKIPLPVFDAKAELLKFRNALPS